MSEWLANNSGALRDYGFLIAFLIVAAWEFQRPRRALSSAPAARWARNLGFYFVGVLCFVAINRLTGGPIGADPRVGWRVGLGLPQWPTGWVGVATAVLLLDAANYWFHRVHHAVFALWRLHALHHSDIDVDVTTNLRHHPAEALSLWAMMSLVYVIFGVPPAAIAVYAVLLFTVQFTHHGNLALPPNWDRRLRAIVVTPDMHRIHHSVLPADGNSNFASVFSGWDRLFGTYRVPVPADDRLTYGLAEFLAPEQQRLGAMMLVPLRVRRFA